MKINTVFSLFTIMMLFAAAAVAGCTGDAGSVGTSDLTENPIDMAPPGMNESGGGQPPGERNMTDRGPGTDIEDQIASLEALGYDLSDVRAALDEGNSETASGLLMQFISEHAEELPMPGNAPSKMQV